MDPFFNYLALTYLIYPILGLLCVGLGFFVAKKNDLLSNKRLIGYFLGMTAILVVPALLGFLDYNFMPVAYLLLACFYMILGVIQTHLVSWVFKKEVPFLYELILTGLLTLTGMLFFMLVFNLCNELKYGGWAATCILPFLLVPVFIQSYRLFLLIPLPVYKLWIYGEDTDISETENIDYNRLKVVMLEVFKQETDQKPITLNAKAADDMLFGVWFKRLLSDYNISSPLYPIDNYSDEPGGGWIFYVKPSIVQPRRYLDYEQTFRQNKIGERYTIVAKRVKVVKNTNKQ